MTWAEYVELSARTANSELDWHEQGQNWALGLIGEAGEVTDLVKKHLFHKHEMDTEKLSKEIGDVCWYIAALVRRLRTKLNKSPLRFKTVRESLYLDDQFFWYEASLKVCKIRRYMLAQNCVEMARHIGTLCYEKQEAIYALVNVLHCLISIANTFNLSMEDILQQNIDKLKARYPEGFSSADSINRTEAK